MFYPCSAKGKITSKHRPEWHERVKHTRYPTQGENGQRLHPFSFAPIVFSALGGISNESYKALQRISKSGPLSKRGLVSCGEIVQAAALKVVRMSALLKREAWLGLGLGSVATRPGEPGIGPEEDESEADDDSVRSSPAPDQADGGEGGDDQGRDAFRSPGAGTFSLGDLFSIFSPVQPLHDVLQDGRSIPQSDRDRRATVVGSAGRRVPRAQPSCLAGRDTGGRSPPEAPGGDGRPRVGFGTPVELVMHVPSGAACRSGDRPPEPTGPEGPRSTEGDPRYDSSGKSVACISRGLEGAFRTSSQDGHSSALLWSRLPGVQGSWLAEDSALNSVSVSVSGQLRRVRQGAGRAEPSEGSNARISSP